MIAENMTNKISLFKYSVMPKKHLSMTLEAANTIKKQEIAFINFSDKR